MVNPCITTVGQAYFFFGAGAGALGSNLIIQSPNRSFWLPAFFLELELELLAPRKVLKQELELSAPKSIFRAGAGAFDFFLYFRAGALSFKIYRLLGAPITFLAQPI